MTNAEKQLVESAIVDGIKAHFEHRRRDVDDFVLNKFRYPGCWHTNKPAFGFDLLRSPLNLLWAPFYILFVLLLLGASKLGLTRAATWASGLPGGMTTQVQKKINKDIEEQLLQPEKLKIEIAEKITALPLVGAHELVENRKRSQALEKVISESLKQLMLTRTASADITNTLFSTAAGAILFKKFTPGGFGLGMILAALWAEHQARKNFFLGETVGSWYYSIFPPQPELWETSLGILLIMICLAVVASFSGLITDPIQANLGLHKKRLTKLINQLEADILEKTQNRFKPLDPYIARILELFDTVKSQLSL